MRAFVYTGGAVFPEGITERPQDGDLVIAADSGYLNARKLGVTPSVLLGDFDSLGEPSALPGVEILRVPAEKDLTDTQLAVQTALERGADQLVIIGGLSGRVDHTLSNLAILEDMWEKKIPCVLTDGKNRARFVRNGSTLIPRAPHFRYLSLIVADPKVHGVSIEGCKYPLKNATLSRTYQYAVSNELDGNCALISVRRGGVWILECAD